MMGNVLHVLCLGVIATQLCTVCAAELAPTLRNNIQCTDPTSWSGVDNQCGNCTVLAQIHYGTGYARTCDDFCAANSLSCVGAWENQVPTWPEYESCTIEETYSCSTDIPTLHSTSDYLCQCISNAPSPAPTMMPNPNPTVTQKPTWPETCPITRDFCVNDPTLEDNCDCGDCGYPVCGDCDCDHYGDEQCCTSGYGKETLRRLDKTTSLPDHPPA